MVKYNNADIITHAARSFGDILSVMETICSSVACHHSIVYEVPNMLLNFRIENSSNLYLFWREMLHSYTFYNKIH